MLRQKIDSERLLDESSRWIVTIPSAETVDAHTVSYISKYYLLLGCNCSIKRIVLLTALIYSEFKRFLIIRSTL